jgi:hypothetical protein
MGKVASVSLSPLSRASGAEAANPAFSWRAPRGETYDAAVKLTLDLSVLRNYSLNGHPAPLLFGRWQQSCSKRAAHVGCKEQVGLSLCP